MKMCDINVITKGKRLRRYLVNRYSTQSLVGWGLEIMEDDEGRWVMSGAAEAKAAEIRVFQVMKTMEDTYAGN
ncbi:unnamed protein product [Prunus armeniaca]